MFLFVSIFLLPAIRTNALQVTFAHLIEGRMRIALKKALQRKLEMSYYKTSQIVIFQYVPFFFKCPAHLIDFLFFYKCTTINSVKWNFYAWTKHKKFNQFISSKDGSLSLNKHSEKLNKTELWKTPLDSCSPTRYFLSCLPK